MADLKLRGAKYQPSIMSRRSRTGLSVPADPLPGTTGDALQAHPEGRLSSRHPAPGAWLDSRKFRTQVVQDVSRHPCPLPRGAGSAPSPEAAQAPPNSARDGGRPLRSRPRLLLVEDDFILRAHLAELLMMEGYEVACAADGAEALSRLLREPLPSVIVLDIGLPRIDGCSFRTVQLQSPTARDIPTIAFTSLTDSAKLEQFSFDAVVRKAGAMLDELTRVLATICPCRAATG